MMDSDFDRPTRSKGLPSGLDASTVLDLPPTPGVSHVGLGGDVGGGFDGDGFGGAVGTDIMSGGLFEGDIFDDVPMDVPNPPEPLDDTLIAPGPSTSGEHQQDKAPELPAAESDDDDAYGGDNFGADGPPSVGGSSRSASPAPSVAPESVMGPPPPPANANATRQTRRSAAVAAAAALAETTAQANEQTTLIQNEDESFALAPVDASALRGWPRTRRKRKLIVDEVKNISGEEMKAQLADTTDIVTTLDLAPPTKRLMHWKETGGVERLFALSGRNIPGKHLFEIYSRHLQSRELDNDELPDPAPEDAIQLPPSEEEGRLITSLLRTKVNPRCRDSSACWKYFEF